jgi:hypothetical protein
MKKFLVLLIFFGCGIIACNENENPVITPVEADEQAAFDDLQTQLNAFSVDFMASLPPAMQRADDGGGNGGGKLPWWKKLVITAMDAIGALAGAAVGTATVAPIIGTGTGAVIGATVASLAAVIAVSGENFGNGDSPDQESFNDDWVWSGNNPEDSIGIYHNQILDKIFEQYPHALDSSITFLATQVIKEAAILGFALPEAKQEDFVTNIVSDVKTFVNAISLPSGLIPEALLDSAVTKYVTKYPEQQNEFLVLQSFLQNVSKLNTDTDIEDYTQGFREVVTSSVIPTESKKFIQEAVSVGANSSVFWKE